MILKVVGGLLVVAACSLDLASYFKQIAKIRRTKHSTNVSSQSYMLKLLKIACSMTALLIFTNWIGLFMEFSAFVVCLVTFSQVIKYKPRGWKLFHFSK